MPALLTQDVDAVELGFRPSAPSALTASRIGEVGREDLDPLAELGGQLLELLDAGAGQADDRALGVQRPAIASPMPPDAPVTRALRPVRSNMFMCPFQS